MDNNIGLLGLDLGSHYLKVAWKEPGSGCFDSLYLPHHGEPLQELERLINGDLRRAARAGSWRVRVTGAGLELLGDNALAADHVGATIADVLAHGGADCVIDVGAGSLTLIELDGEGRFAGYNTNSLCAAGTGSFLDEQAVRLGISFEDMRAMDHVTEPPTIATRCTVFAKSDLIHRQQEGCSREAMWSGLCRGLSQTMISTLFKGRPVKGRIALVGGVSLNREVLRWLEADCPNARFVTIPDAHVATARGAARLADEENGPAVTLDALLRMVADADRAERGSQARADDARPLALVKTRYPSFAVDEDYTDADGTEIRIASWPAPGEDARVTLGIDIGSTSTKLVVMDQRGAVRADLYRKTLGDPIGATKRLFSALRDIEHAKGSMLCVAGCGTTGSGRRLVGQVIGADAIVNEISAHVAGAMSVDPSIETIFEIGGQDSKYMHTQGGAIRDANMNYACAAGTGSFVEEQAKKLGFALAEVGDAVLGLTPPKTSDRCTVFMEQDVHKLIRQGCSRDEAMAGVMHSVVQNYLVKVVGRRPVSQGKVFFQGATARNKGLVAAFERHLGVEVVVSPHCHQMGSIGVALITRAMMEERGAPSSFAGLGLADRRVELVSTTCRDCTNSCRITEAVIEGEERRPAFGHMCGRERDGRPGGHAPGYELVRARQRLWLTLGNECKAPSDAPVIGIPRALTTYTFLPFWRRFFGELGFKVRLSPESNEETKKAGAAAVGADFCFPVKLAHGHVRELLLKEGVDHVLLPTMVSTLPQPGSPGGMFCPYVQGVPGVVVTALSTNGVDTGRVLAPVVDFRKKPEHLAADLARDLAGPLCRTQDRIARALKWALEVQADFERRCQEEGERTLARLERRNGKGIVLVGRPYNIYDMGSNVALPRKIAEQGFTVIPVDCLPLRSDLYRHDFKNIYWSYGQRILSAKGIAKRHPLLHSISLTNFSCGPDSFLLTYGDTIDGKKPSLTLELDEHGADAGYMTRIEAFADVVRRHRPEADDTRVSYPPEGAADLRRRVVWIPPMHPFGSRFFAAMFRGFGYDARALPPEDHASFEEGRRATRGFECLPTTATIGALLKALETSAPGERHAVLMPTAEGPCRFGQYATLHRLILNRRGFEDVFILSPSSYNSYQGLEEPLRAGLWRAMLAADVLFKMGCKLRPYELEPGRVDAELEAAACAIEKALTANGSPYRAVSEAALRLSRAPRSRERKPLVGIVGEIYVRCNPFTNDNLVDMLEQAGGEAWLTPMHEWILYTSTMARLNRYRSASGDFSVADYLAGTIKDKVMLGEERVMYRAAGELLADRHEPDMEDILARGRRYVSLKFQGEAILSLGRAELFREQGAAMVVNAAPFGCMPGTISAACMTELQQRLKIPFAQMFYDGAGDANRRLRVFLSNLKDGPRPAFV
ncbi:MAG: acyl-CoA dehydratase activase [Deltaproteobacteria bacterium]|nr:acyl-CoA dehydratase activase [Deltaproteobacteria bacterium]